MAQEASSGEHHEAESSEPAASWVGRAVGEIRRGRHVILHGNVRDFVRWGDDYYPLANFLTTMLQDELGFSVVAWYDVFEGLSFRHGEEAGRRLFAEPDGRIIRQLPQALGQKETRIAFVWEFSDLAFTGEPLSREERQTLAWTDAAMRAAEFIENLPNALILLARELDRVPAWLFRANPFVSTVQIESPNVKERQRFVTKFANLFFGGPELFSSGAVGAEPGPEFGDASMQVAALTEGMSLRDLFLISRTSQLERLPLTEAKELVSTHVYGSPEDPWEQLSRESFQQAEGTIAQEVIGQGAAVAQVARILVAAASGIDYDAGDPGGETRPRGVFFFVGPTGVGKTETAKEIAALVFGDRSHLLRFDMSEFREPHSAERFTGAPPGYVGFERGGQLVERVLERPFSVLLFDEIEKAHPLVLDRFLQILDDGRLTDGQGRTAYFRNCVIIFTSNEGSRQIQSKMREDAAPGYEEIVAHYRTAVERKIRPELWGRLRDGVIVFDILRNEAVLGVTSKFLDRLRRSAADQEIELVFDASVAAAISDLYVSDPSLRTSGGRGIREAVDRLVRHELAAWVVELRRTGTWRVAWVDGGLRFEAADTQ